MLVRTAGRRRGARRAVTVLLASVGAAILPAAPADGARGLRLGYSDVAFTHAGREPLLDEAAADGASVVRIALPWIAVAPERPSDPTDPVDPAYAWEATDVSISAARARGLRVLVMILGAPPWAQGRGRPPGDLYGAWKPDPAALAKFATAAARRYRGVASAWQIWNEPNLQTYLAPQWERGVNAASRRYRALLNSAYTAIKAVDRRATIVTAGTAPFGDPPGGRRTKPLVFWDGVLARRTRFDAWAHHPYGVGGPARPARSPLDVGVPDVHRIGRLVRRATAAGRAVPRGPKPGWVTEVGWDTGPPDPFGVPPARQARWLSAALYGLWRQGVRTIMWHQVRDAPPDPSYGATSQSATRLVDGTPKPSMRAFRFPFAAGSPRRGRVRVWGVAPAAGRVDVQRRLQDRWRTVSRRRTGFARVFSVRIRASRGTVLRARAGGARSLTWRVGRDG